MSATPESILPDKRLYRPWKILRLISVVLVRTLQLGSLMVLLYSNLTWLKFNDNPGTSWSIWALVIWQHLGLSGAIWDMTFNDIKYRNFKEISREEQLCAVQAFMRRPPCFSLDLEREKRRFAAELSNTSIPPSVYCPWDRWYFCVGWWASGWTILRFHAKFVKVDFRFYDFLDFVWKYVIPGPYGEALATFFLVRRFTWYDRLARTASEIKETCRLADEEKGEDGKRDLEWWIENMLREESNIDEGALPKSG